MKKANISAKLYPNKEFATKASLGHSLELPLQTFFTQERY